MSYSDKLKDPRWQKKRLEVLSRDNFTCKLCGDSETELHVHHVEYLGEPWEQDLSRLDTLCKHCHLCLKETSLNYDQIDSSIKKVSKDDARITTVSFNSSSTKSVDLIMYCEGLFIQHTAHISHDFILMIKDQIDV